MAEEKKSKLQIIRIFDTRLIPREFIEALDYGYNTRIFYKIPLLNDSANLFYVLATEDYKTVGFLWATINVINYTLYVNSLYVEEEYRGGVIEMVDKFLTDIAKKVGLKAIYWATRTPELFEKKGYKRSEEIMMKKEIE